MKSRDFHRLAFIFTLLSCGMILAPAQVFAQEQRVEELTRGPIHEAFASSVSFNPAPGILIDGSPPEMIEEIPPDQRLEGDNISWIPGYWAWDEDQNDFIWISGIWRKLPPGRQWNPGYWGQVENQSQWTSGYWAGEETQEVAYLPSPPKSLEMGPNIAAPSNNHIWVSGNWTHRDDRYGWTPGYWEPAQQDWIWIPAHYQWTYRGYVFVDGYWDYSVSRRGVMFAPVRFHGDSYRQPGYSYTPLLAISLNVLMDHLFVRPSYGHYYFGDYYRPSYRDNGYFASHSYYSERRGYDPIYAHNRWEHRGEPDWDQNRITNFNFYRDHESDRPAHNWAAMQKKPVKNRENQSAYAFAQPYSQYATRSDSGQRFQSVSKKNQDEYREQRQQIRDYGQQRRKLESKPLDKANKGGQMSREKFAKSPLAAKRPEQLEGKDVPPKRLAPRVAEKVDPRKGGEPQENANKPSKKPEQKPRPKPQAEPSKKSKPDVKPEGKAKETKPTPERVTKPESKKGKSPEQNVEPSKPKKADSPTKPKAAQQPQNKDQQAPGSHSESQQKRQPKQAEKAKPVEKPDTKPEASPVVKPSRDPSEKDSAKKDTDKKPAKEENNKQKKQR